jgi:hypothetical protein
MHVELRVVGKKLPWPFYLKVVWIFATVVLLLVGFGSCLAGEEPCSAAAPPMQVFMFLLSFPSSVIFFICSLPIYGSGGIQTPMNYVSFWLGAFVVGYLQWFVLIPRLAAPAITSLNLGVGTGPKHRSRRRRKRRAVEQFATNEVKAFDAEGKTPIERVFSAHI